MQVNSAATPVAVPKAPTITQAVAQEAPKAPAPEARQAAAALAK